MVSQPARPFLRWAGGKHWLGGLLQELALSADRQAYVEPFVGGGAAFFAVRPQAAILADLDAELVHTYTMVRDRPEAVVRALQRRILDKQYYDSIRQNVPAHPVSRAARFMYLNRASFNGLYRVNSSGEFNVPYGPKPGTVLCQSDRIRLASRILRNTTILSGDFRETSKFAPARSMFYFDPPYTVTHNLNGFRRYNGRLFAWDDQVALAELSLDLSTSGHSVVISNAFHESVLELYPASEFVRLTVQRRTAMAADPDKRGRSTEVLIVSKALYTSFDADRSEPLRGLGGVRV